MLKFISGSLVLLLAFLAVWGQCAACPLIVPEKDCCGQHSGNCQMPSPKPQTDEHPCPDQALAPAAHHDTQANLVQAVAPAPVPVAIEAPAMPAWLPAVPETEVNTGPPVLYLLNSVLLV